MKKWLMGDNSVIYRVMVLVHFLSLPYIYKPSFISIPFVLSKIWHRQASIMKNKRLWGDNSINMQGRIMVLGFSPSLSLPSIYKPSFI